MKKAEAKSGERASRRRAVRHHGTAAKVGTADLPPTGSTFVSGFMSQAGVVDVDRVADAFRMSKGQLALTAGLALA